MKSILKLFASLLMILGWMQVIGQDCEPYMVVNQGAVREMTNYDKKDKVTGTSVQTVKEIKTEGNMTEWTINSVSKDAKGKQTSAGDLQMTCEAGIFKMDMKNFIDEETMKGFEGMEVAMDATDLDYPAILTPGMTLKDGNITIKASSQGVPVMTLVVRIYDRKVLALEDITTPAGTFQCYKISQTVETKTLFTVIAKTTDWIAKKVGTVRSETFDKNSNLQGYMILTAMK